MISIIIPVFNAQEFLCRCLESIYNQSYSDYEVIIVDDGSIDQSLKIAKEWENKDKRIRVVTQQNSGVGKARNRGIYESRGEWICFIDSDDYVEPTYLEMLVKHISPNMLSVCNFVYNNDKHMVFSSSWENYIIKFDDSFIRDYLVYSIGRTIAFSTWNKLFDNHLLHENNIFFPENIVVGEDMIFVLKYLSYCKEIHFINEGLYHYFIRDDSVMNNKGKDYLISYENTLNYLKSITFHNGLSVDKETINLWSRESLLIVLTNPYIKSMRYKEFCKYYKSLKISMLVRHASLCKTSKNYKRLILSLVLKLKSRAILYMLIKTNR